MDFFILVFISLVNMNIYSQPLGIYSSMDDCFVAREILVESVGRPIKNYQAVCVNGTDEDLTSL